MSGYGDGRRCTHCAVAQDCGRKSIDAKICHSPVWSCCGSSCQSDSVVCPPGRGDFVHLDWTGRHFPPHFTSGRRFEQGTLTKPTMRGGRSQFGPRTTQIRDSPRGFVRGWKLIILASWAMCDEFLQG